MEKQVTEIREGLRNCGNGRTQLTSCSAGMASEELKEKVREDEHDRTSSF